MDMPDNESSLWTPRGLLLGLSVVSLAIGATADMDPRVFAGGLRIAP
jgi:hypothetical protein